MNGREHFFLQWYLSEEQHSTPAKENVRARTHGVLTHWSPRLSWPIRGVRLGWWTPEQRSRLWKRSPVPSANRSARPRPSSGCPCTSPLHSGPAFTSIKETQKKKTQTLTHSTDFSSSSCSYYIVAPLWNLAICNGSAAINADLFYCLCLQPIL